MDLIDNNPYRVIGVAASASVKEIQSRKGKIQAYAKVGKQITSDYDFSFLGQITRSNIIIDKAFSDIEQNQEKLTYSLFWFTNVNSIDNAALQHLIAGNKQKALEIWKKITHGREINSRNFSAFNNVGTLYLLGQSLEEIKQGIDVKILLIESDSFNDLVNTVADETYIVDKQKQAEAFVNAFLLQVKDKYSTAETMGLFANCKGTIKKLLSERFTREPIYIIESQIAQAINKRTKDKSKANLYGKDLYKNTINELNTLKSILDAASIQFQMLADNVAKEILQCSIDYFNESQEQEKVGNYLEDAMRIARLAETVAISVSTKERIKDCIATLLEMKDRELTQAIEALKSVKTAYEASKVKIISDVNGMSLGYNQSINWSKVNQMIEDSISWDKVVELLQEVIPPKDVEKIKLSNKLTEVKEYKSLVDFVFERLSYSQKSKVKYLRYWDLHNIFDIPIAPQRPVIAKKPTSTTQKSATENNWIEENPGCLIMIIIAVVVFLVIVISK